MYLDVLLQCLAWYAGLTRVSCCLRLDFWWYLIRYEAPTRSRRDRHNDGEWDTTTLYRVLGPAMSLVMGSHMPARKFVSLWILLFCRRGSVFLQYLLRLTLARIFVLCIIVKHIKVHEWQLSKYGHSSHLARLTLYSLRFLISGFLSLQLSHTSPTSLRCVSAFLFFVKFIVFIRHIVHSMKSISNWEKWCLPVIN